jgi:hypothetical protein
LPITLPTTVSPNDRRSSPRHLDPGRSQGQSRSRDLSIGAAIDLVGIGLLADDLRCPPGLIRPAWATRRRIRQITILALSTKLLVVALDLTGFAESNEFCLPNGNLSDRQFPELFTNSDVGQ